MASVNRVILIGHLGRDPDVKYAANSGDAICNFSMATTEKWRDKHTGENKETTEWHTVNSYGRLAEICEKYLRKGTLVYVEGKLSTRKWQDKNTGQEKQRTEVRLDAMQILSGRKDAQQGSDEHEAAAPARTSAARQQLPEAAQPAYTDDDIPF